jgi:hypothetical protein
MGRCAGPCGLPGPGLRKTWTGGVSKTGDVEMNPVQIVTILAYALASNNTSKTLRMLYDIGSKMVKP